MSMFHPVIEKDIKEIISVIRADLQRLEGKNILITGASGMLASYLVYTLIYANEYIFKKRAQLYLVIRKKTSPFGSKKYIHYLHKDIAKDKLRVTNLHYVVHAASKAAPKIYTRNMLDTLNTNILGLYTVLSLVDKNTRSILYFSSGEVYGEPKTGTPIGENYLCSTDHLNQRSCYVEGKRICETICMNYFWEKNYPIKVARIFHTFGPGLNVNDGRVFSDFIRDGLVKKDIEIKGDQNLVRPFLYIKDATIMFFKILLLGKNGEVYNVSNDKNIISVGELAKTVCEVFNNYGGKKMEVKLNKQDNKYYRGAVKQILPDISKFRKAFGYTPAVSVSEALTNTIRYLLSNDQK